MARTLNTTEVAEALETTPRELRKFLRSADGKNATVGKGARWSIEAREVRSLKTRFAKWTAAKAVADEAPDAEVEVDAPAETD